MLSVNDTFVASGSVSIVKVLMPGLQKQVSVFKDKGSDLSELMGLEALG
jgi:hypothetical protein